MRIIFVATNKMIQLIDNQLFVKCK